MASSSNSLPGNKFNDITPAFVCSICLELFEKPKMLPSCGHSFCYKCLVQISGRTSMHVVCPECRMCNIFGREGVDGLKTNIQLQRVVEVFKVVEQNSDFEDATNDSCKHLFFVSKSTLCPHCNSFFCQTCLSVHKERLKVDILERKKQVENRLADVLKKSELKVVSVTAHLEAAEDLLKERLSLYFGDLEMAILSALVEKKEAMLKLAGEIKKVEIAKAEKAIDDMKEKSLLVFLEPTVEKLASSSSLDLPLDELADLIDKMALIDKELESMEQMNDAVARGRFGFRRMASLKDKLLQEIEGFKPQDHIRWFPKSPEK